MGSLIDLVSGVFHQPWMLAGLAALILPPLIHLLNRRRFDVVEWGAMQFLQVSETTRRRLFLEELLLMALRMLLLAVLVLAVAGPFLTSTTLARLASQSNRDVVLIFDGSASMAATDKGPTPQEAAQQWARDFLEQRLPGDGLAVLQAREQVVPILDSPSRDFPRVRQAIDRLPPPAGETDWRLAIRQAWAILEHSRRAEREIILLTDGQRHGWADPQSLVRWEILAGELSRAGANQPRPRLWVVNVAPSRSASLPNWSLAALETTRPLVPVDREVRFRTALELHGQKSYTPPHRIRLEIDGKWARDLAAPPAGLLENGKVPLEFSSRFVSAGSHLVSVIVEPDPPVEDRPADYVVKDVLPADNRQDFAIEVVPVLPVLLVTSDAGPSTRQRSRFLRDALAPANDPAPVVQVRQIPLSEFGAEAGRQTALPRVVILSNVSQLSAPQQQAVEQLLAAGAGVLVTLGGHTDRTACNDHLYRDGKGWLPVRLDRVAGDESQPEKAAHPEPGSTHPALSLFLPRQGREAGRLPRLEQARFPRWWHLSTPERSSASVVVCSLRGPDGLSPLLVEGIRPDRAGRVLACAVPLDDSWGSNVVRTSIFVPLIHELVYYLAGARALSFNLHPGQALRWRLEGPAEGFTLQTPSAGPRPVQVGKETKDGIPAIVDRRAEGAVLRIEGMQETGVYQLRTPAGQTIYYVLRPRSGDEADLTPAADDERKQVAELVHGLTYENQLEPVAQSWVSESHRQDLWSWLLLGMIVLLCAEVWMTRRMVRRQEMA